MESMGVASEWNLWVWLVGRIYGCVIRRWVWLQCIGVVSGWCCQEVYRYPHILYPYSTCISSFLQQQHPYFLFIVRDINVPRSFATDQTSLL